MSHTRTLSRRTTIRALAVATAVTAWLAPFETPGAHAATGDAVWTSGLNSDGQLGDGTTTSRAGFARVALLDGADDVAGGREHAAALVGGQVYTWGDGSKGALGLGSLADQPTPTVVPGLSGVTAISTGHYSTLALMADGTVRDWGLNANGQQGDGTTTTKSSPTTVTGLSGVVQVAAGRDMHLALLADGTVRTWGMGTHGELGNGATTAKQTTPVTADISDVRFIAGGRNHVLAIKRDGTLWAWGQNEFGQLGDGTKTSRTRPVQVPGLTDVVDVQAGAEFTVAVTGSGQVYTWGHNNSGQLGRGGSLAQDSNPGLVGGLPAISRVGAGRAHDLAVTTTGQLWAWGLDVNGALGDRAGSARRAPVIVTGMTGVRSVHGGYGYSVVLRSS